ncbi:uncharacterized protein LOC122375344 isoform X4 [Amphibalanus amphitrite]|uniref:uncharacterized protein LOC122375344 isoform X4 n=1 Tax=Amphibalanus amphitrite TaxID=1232801 RepID=UPI001C921AB5|nr:uncharacterized protein LOC122375344 isoform X4 [Amphibalanus amphitrite]
MADLEKLKRRKISAQGWLTRTVVKLEQSLSLKEVKVIDLESLLCDFDKRLSDFDVAEELLEQELPEDGIMEAIEAAGEIRDRAVDVRNKAQQTLGVLKVKDGADDSASCASASQLGSADPSVKLPKLQLPKFSGNVLEWPQFWDAFSVTVDASDLPEVTKLTYLRSLLTGEAAKSVEGLALSKVNYKTTCEILKDRFGRKEQIIYNHIQALLQSSCDKKSEGLKSFQDELLVHVRSLENLDITGERYGVVLTPIIVSRLPEVIRMEWARKSAGKEADLEFLLEFLKEEIQCRERSQTFKCGAMASDSGRETEKKRDHQAGRFAGQRQRVAAASVLHTAAARSNCGICHDSHPPAKCPELLKLAVRDRPGKIRDSGLCFRCLKEGHRGNSCGARCDNCREVGYGAAVYLRLTLRDGSVVTPLVMSRARVAPLKQVSLPRLELLASLLAARLLRFVCRALKLPSETLYWCWTDSMVSLGWIKGDPSRWKQFVKNRVIEIQSLTDPAQWSHCPGQDNPADLITRGVYAEALTDSPWFSGPDWLSDCAGADLLSSPEVLLPESELFSAAEGEPAAAAVESASADVSSSPESELFVAAEGQLAAAAATSDCSQPVFEVTRFSSLTKAIRVVGLVLRFIGRLKESRSLRLSQGRHPASSYRSPSLSYVELSEAKTCLIKVTQLQAFPDECRALNKGMFVDGKSRIASLRPFVDDKGLLRVRSRLANTDLTLGEKCPILIPKGHLADLMIRFQHELLKHCGVDTLLTTLRNEYWIVGGRRAAKRVKRACTACQRQDAAALNAPVAPLPAQRASKAPPFSVTGVDFCGPLFCLPKQKVYVCLFTCAVTRAIHLELTDSMSQSEFLLAFRRFCARRGTPTMMYSDNAKTFRAAATSLLAELGPAGPEWKFIAPRAAWWGGHWERLVRTVKSSLRKTLGRSVLSKVELETLLLEVEACVNSRPLTFVSDDVDGARPLTPSHFLSGRVAGVRAFVVDDSDQVSASSLTERDVEHQNMLAKFWSVWQTDYLRSLPHSVKKFKSRGKLQIGSVVLIREDNVPRLHWLMGVVEHLHPGSDGVVRAADVRTAQGVRTRPVQRLHDLEVLD